MEKSGVTFHNIANVLTHVYMLCTYSRPWVLMLKKQNKNLRDDLIWSSFTDETISPREEELPKAT